LALQETIDAAVTQTFEAFPTEDTEALAADAVQATFDELTRIAPTDTPISIPTDLQTDTPTTTETPTNTPEPAPDLTLFEDNFDSGISDEWNISGNNYSMVNGELASEGWINATVGDENWKDYEVTIELTYLIFSGWEDGLQFHIRRLDDNNYMALQINTFNVCSIQWLAMQNGEERIIANTKTEIARWQDCHGTFEIIAEGETYIVKKDGRTELTINDPTFDRGGFGIIAFEQQERLNFTIDDIVISAINQ
jgi:hypothetical protein